MCGFHGCIESASAIMKGYEIYYNLIRKHQGINCCPYELAIPKLELERYCCRALFLGHIDLLEKVAQFKKF